MFFSYLYLLPPSTPSASSLKYTMKPYTNHINIRAEMFSGSVSIACVLCHTLRTFKHTHTYLICVIIYSFFFISRLYVLLVCMLVVSVIIVGSILLFVYPMCVSMCEWYKTLEKKTLKFLCIYDYYVLFVIPAYTPLPSHPNSALQLSKTYIIWFI